MYLLKNQFLILDSKVNAVLNKQLTIILKIKTQNLFVNQQVLGDHMTIK